MKFITAIYNGLYGSKYGGRLNRDDHYLKSLRCLSNMGAEILCYTSQKDKPTLEKFIEDNHITNVKLVVYELDTMKYHNVIQELKEYNKDLYSLDNVWVYRCVELMWLKVFWVHELSQKYKNEKVFWIDSGLAHGGILPTKLTEQNNLEDSRQHNYTKAFNKNTLTYLDKLSEDGLFTFYCNHRQHGYQPLFEHGERLPGSVVAGLFGGKADSIEFLYQEFVKLIDYMIENKTLMQEEMIMTLIYQKYMDKFTVYDFDTWYHPDWDCYNPDLKSFSKFFEDMHVGI